MEINKEDVYKECLRIASAKEDELKRQIADTRESNNDTKSSMGDKYETSREMLQQQINMLEKQLAEASLQLYHLSVINPMKKNNIIETGSLVETNIGMFYIAISLGEMDFHETKVFVISPVAPLGKLLIGKKRGDRIMMNSKEISIIDVV